MTRHRSPVRRRDPFWLLTSLAVGALLMVAACAISTPMPSFPASTVAPAAAPAAAASSAAAAALEQLPVVPSRPLVSCRKGTTNQPAGCYARALFLPRGWDDPDGNRCDARRDTLARQAVGDVRSAIPRGGKTPCVISATVHDPYSNTDLPSTRAQVDHVVALANAWVTGADQWTPVMREAMANDPHNLLAVTGTLNASKGDSPADRWLPPAEGGFRCGYVAQQIRVKTIYRLGVTTAERDAMRRVLGGCPGQVLPV